MDKLFFYHETWHHVNPLWRNNLENTTYASADQEILGYIHSTYTREMGQELITALSILYDVSYPNLQEKLVGYINGLEAEDEEGLSIIFSKEIDQGVTDVLHRWGIELRDDVSLDVKTKIATGLNMVMSVEDPVPYIRILDTDLEPAEKLARIVAEFTLLADVVFMESVESIDKDLLQRLYNELLKQEERVAPPIEEAVDSRQVENFKMFCQYLGKEHIAYQLLQNNFAFGMTSDVYLVYAAPYLHADSQEQTALNLLSYFLMASDTWESPLEAYRKTSEVLVHNPRDILPVENAIRRMLEGLEQYKRTLNESK